MDADVRSGGGGGGESQPCRCDCSCPCCGSDSGPSSPLNRSLKSNPGQIEENAQCGRPENVARVEVESEAAALREALASQQQSMRGLCVELEAERAAASTAASEAMSMILRLQREKAESQMEARQFKRLAEERMSHDLHEIALLEDLLVKRDEAVRSLSCKLQVYHHRLLSYGINPVPTEPDSPTVITAGGGNNAYSPLLCELGDFRANDADPDLKYDAGDTLRGPIQRVPCLSLEKDVIKIGQSPSWAQRDHRRLSIDSFGSGSFRQDSGSTGLTSMADRVSDKSAGGRDDISDGLYTIDAAVGVDRVYDGADKCTPREFLGRRHSANGTVDEGDVKRLCMKLQALEADRESMRQAIMTMGTDKAQRILLKEIAQQMCKEVVPDTRIVRKPSSMRSFSVMSVFKCMASLFFWRKKSARIKYPLGSSNQKTGLLFLLDRSQRKKRLKRCLTRLPS